MGRGGRVRIQAFVGASVDGFIARRDGALDFLPDVVEDHGYGELMASVDTLLVGRRTYDTVLAFPDWPWGDKRIVVLSHRPVPQPKPPHKVEPMVGTPAEVADQLAATGARNVYLDGGVAIQQFLAAGLVDRLTVTRVPVLIGEGTPLFGALPRDVRLRHVSTRSFPSGLVQSVYDVVR